MLLISLLTQGSLKNQLSMLSTDSDSSSNDSSSSDSENEDNEDDDEVDEKDVEQLNNFLTSDVCIYSLWHTCIY